MPPFLTKFFAGSFNRGVRFLGLGFVPMDTFAVTRKGAGIRSRVGAAGVAAFIRAFTGANENRMSCQSLFKANTTYCVCRCVVRFERWRALYSHPS